MYNPLPFPCSLIGQSSSEVVCLTRSVHLSHLYELPQEGYHSLRAVLVGRGKIDLVAEHHQPSDKCLFIFYSALLMPL